jgi:hypothetical protein
MNLHEKEKGRNYRKFRPQFDFCLRMRRFVTHWFGFCILLHHLLAHGVGIEFLTRLMGFAFELAQTFSVPSSFAQWSQRKVPAVTVIVSGTAREPSIRAFP